jgi:hypothetical protein
MAAAVGIVAMLLGRMRGTTVGGDDVIDVTC